MKAFFIVLASAVIVSGLAAASLAQVAGASGEQVYRTRCASCHDQASPRIPPRDALQKMSALRILRALDFGAMMTVAYPLSRDERQAVAGFLGVAGPPSSPPPSAFCSDRRVKLDDPARPASPARMEWNGWSPASTNSRFQS